MPSDVQTRQFILLPLRGLRADGRTASDDARAFLLEANQAIAPRTRGMSAAPRVARLGAPRVKMRVLDAIAEDGAKLVEMSPTDAMRLREQQPGLKLVPVVYYYPQLLR